ncbi:hypothetical protein Lal_00018829 [Lupinus albus]|nr:hypothetical protein Lal_00018829 [Lupinus albus]
MKKGFGIRKYNTCRDKDDEILWQTFFCDREGFRGKKNELVQKRAPRQETRCGCLARMKIHIDKEKASYRRMKETDVAQMNTIREVGIGTCKKFGSFTGQCGGYRYIGFSTKDMYNQIQKQRRIRNGDA